MSHRYVSSYIENCNIYQNTGYKASSNVQHRTNDDLKSMLPTLICGILGTVGQAAAYGYMNQPPQYEKNNPVKEVEQPQQEQKPKTQEEIEAKVESLGFDKNSEYFEDIVTKYDAMKAVNPDISDIEANRRLTNYIDALERQKQLQQIINADFNDPKTLEMGVVDKNMTPEVMQNGESYIRALYNRGEGELAIYDINGDNQVTEEEFIKTETGKTKEELLKKDEGAIQLGAVLKAFMKYNIDRNNVLTADELGAASYASYRLSDYDENDNEISKTGNSMSVDEYAATVAILSGATEPNDPDRKNFTDLQLGAYGMLKNYKP